MKRKLRIKSIEEAYSMQPVIKHVQTKIGLFATSGICEIKLKGEFYIGYDKEKNILFKYRADAVNIEYFRNKIL